MTKTFYDEPYIKEFKTEVISCEEYKKGYMIVLEKTAFFAEGGGQPSDTGTLDEANVLDVHNNNGTILHITDKPLKPGSCVKGIIDWEKRFLNMQLHSGEHIVSGIIHKLFGYDNVGFHMGKDIVTLDVSGELSQADIMEVEKRANKVIYNNIPVKIFYPNDEELKTIDYRSKKEIQGKVRLVNIPKVDLCACCATHVSQTGEIGIIKFVDAMKNKGGTRLFMHGGYRAFKDYEQKHNSVASISHLLSAKTDKVVDAVKKLKSNLDEKTYEVKHLYEELFSLKAANIPKGSDKVCLFEDNLSHIQLRNFANILMDKVDVVLICSGTEEKGYSYVLASKQQDIRSYNKSFINSLNGKGGGNKQMAQGTLFSTKEKIEKYFNHYQNCLCQE